MNIREHPFIVFSSIAISAFGCGWLAHIAIIEQSGMKPYPTSKIENFEQLEDENKRLKTDLQVSSKLNSIISSFNSGDRDGWIVNLLSLNWIPNKGTSLTNGDGYIKTCDQFNDGKTTYFISPAKFHGDLSSFTHLMFSLYSEGGEYFKEADVRIKNKNNSAEYLLLDRPKETWETFLISLTDDQEWKIKGDNITLQEILQNVTSIEIRGEFGSGEDCTGLDNVMLLRE